MAQTDALPVFGKKITQGFIQSIGQEKNVRIARETLRDFMMFNNALESRMQGMVIAVQNGKPLDAELFDKMAQVKDKYNYAMTGFQAFDENLQRHALMSLADSIQDLMFLLHKRRGH